MEKLIAMIKRHFGIVGVVLVWFFIIVSNFYPGKWVSGWDNLHSEFNFSFNLSRSLVSAWQYQLGLGAASGINFASDIFRQVFLWLSSAFVPTIHIRYFWFSLMLLSGPLGVYSFVHWVFGRGKNSSLAAMCASVFYLLNLSVVQTFYTPFEAFASFYGFFPWLIFVSLYYLFSPSLKKLFVVFVSFVFLAPAFYVQTQFIVFLVALTLLFVSRFLFINKRIDYVKKYVALIVAVILASSYWLVPFVYFTLTSSYVVSESKSNMLSTFETFLQNKGFGGFGDIILGRGFWFEYIDAVGGNSFGYLMQEWRGHAFNSWVSLAGGLLFLFSILGVLVALMKRNTHRGRFSPLFLILFAMLMLSSGYGVISGAVFSFFDSLPLFSQVFRSPFTKWSNVLFFGLAWGVGYFVFAVSSYLGKFKYLLAGVVCGLCVFVSLPVFEGRLISNFMRVERPGEYEELTNFFKGEPQYSRVAFMPIQSVWGWNFYSWGYRGSGFLWYGIRQPILDRTFDIWNYSNQAFYQELSQAFYDGDSESFSLVLKKYDVSYLLLDESVILPGTDNTLFKYPQIHTFVAELGLKEVFVSSFLHVYKVENEKSSSFSNVYSQTERLLRDVGYKKGDYYSRRVVDGEYYPFSDLSGTKVNDVEFGSDISGLRFTNFNLEESLGGTLNVAPFPVGKRLRVSGWVSYENSLVGVEFENPMSVFAGDKQVGIPEIFTPFFMATDRQYENLVLSIGGNKVEISSGERKYVENMLFAPYEDLKIDIYDSSHSSSPSLSDAFLNKENVSSCWQRPGGEAYINSTVLDDVLSIETVDAVGCLSFPVGSFSGDGAFVHVNLPYLSSGNSRPHFCLLEEGKQECLHDDVFYNSLPSLAWSSVSRDVFLPGNKSYWLVVAARPSDTKGEKWNISYKVPEVRISNKISSFAFDNSNWKSLIEGFGVKIDEGKLSLRVVSGYFSLPVMQYDLLAAKNCDVLKRGSVEKYILGTSLYFKSLAKGALCESVVVSRVFDTDDYLMRLQGENLSGRGLKFYLYSQSSSRNQVEELTPNGRYDGVYTILGNGGNSGREYVLTLESRSFGKEEALNKVDSIDFYALPLSWISTFSVTGKQASESLVPEYIDYSSVSKGFGVVGVERLSKLLILNQSYDNGWVAFSSGGVLEHFKVNSWANGWLNESGGRVLVFFWPQLLQYVSYCLIVIVGFIGIHFIKKINKD